MKPCIKASDIRKDIKGQLPVIKEEIFKEHFCSECSFYAGRVDKIPHCMLMECPWDGQEPVYDPILLQLLPAIEKEFKKAEKKYLKIKESRDAINAIFEKEIQKRKRKQDACYGCPYGHGARCIGYCYVQQTANPVEKEIKKEDLFK